MMQILEWAPLVVFFAAFKLFGLYWAAASLMVTTVVTMAAHRVWYGRFKIMHIVTATVAVTLGTATLVLHDTRFIQWKPTVLLGAAALAFLGSAVIGKEPLARRLLEGVFSEPLQLSASTWTRINSAWAAWFALLAAANIYVAHHFSENVWVNFKVFGISAAMMAFMIPQVFWLHGKTRSAAAEGA